MKGLMCQSAAAAAVCLSHEQRSVAAPVRIDKSKYVRLGEHQHQHQHQHQHATRFSFHLSSSQSQKNQQPIPHHLFQVVVMRVSLHCQGCAAKLNKHLSKMQGVTSFSIDVESKRVTVAGHVSPSGVLESISKVKKAEFWSC